MKQNKSTLILFPIFIVSCGLLLIYRGQMSADKYQLFNATVKSKTISENQKYNNGIPDGKVHTNLQVYIKQRMRLSE